MKNLPDPELFSAYLDGELTAEQQAQIERLLATSAEARQLLEDLRKLSQSLQRLPTHELPEDLTPQILQEASRRRQRVSPAGASSSADSAGTATAGEILSISMPPGEDSSGRATPVGLPVQESARDLLPRPKSRWEPLFRRLFNSRGIMWASVAVAVAVAIWWWGPSNQDRFRQLAQLPKEVLPAIEQKADQGGIPSVENQDGKPERFAGTVSPESVIRPRSVDKGMENLLAEKSASFPSEDALATSEGRASRRRLGTSPDISKADMADVPKAPPLAPAMDQPQPEPKLSSPGGKSHFEPFRQAPSPSALAEADKEESTGRKGFGAAGAAPVGKAPPSSGSVDRSSEAEPETRENKKASLAKRDEAQTVPMLAKSRSGLPAIEGGVPPPAPGAPPAPEPMSAGSDLQTRPPKSSATPLAEQPTPPPPAWASRKQHDFASPEMATKPAGSPRIGTPMLQGVGQQEQVLPQLVPETTMVVVCDLSASAFQQRAFEQILSSQQISIQQGEEVLKDLWEAADREEDGSLPGVKENLGSGEEKSGGPRGGQALPGGAAKEPVPRSTPEEKKSPQTQKGREHSPDRSVDIALQSPKRASSNLSAESQLQFVLVEATAQQVEEALKAMQARPEQFLALSVSPAPGDPSQQMYQQYNRAYRQAARTTGQAPGEERAFQGTNVQPLPSGKGPASAIATQGFRSPPAPGIAAPSPPAAPTPPSGELQKQSEESQKEKELAERSLESASAKPLRNGAGGGGQGQQTFRDQQAWARRLRLPEHLSRQFSQTQQVPPPSEQIDPARSSAPTPPSAVPERHSSSAEQRPGMLTPPGQNQGAEAGIPEAKIMSGSSSESGKAPLSAVPKEAVPPAGKPSDAAALPPTLHRPSQETEKKPERQQTTPIPDQAEPSSLSRGPQSPGMIRVLFVLRPGEDTP